MFYVWLVGGASAAIWWERLELTSGNAGDAALGRQASLLGAGKCHSKLNMQIASHNVQRCLYATLLVGYLLLIVQDRGPSERGLVPVLEYAPVILLLWLVLRLSKAIWWFFVLVAGVYAASIIFVLMRQELLIGQLSMARDDIYKLLGFAWVCVVLWYGRPKKS